MIGQSFFAVVGTFFSITPAIVYLVAGYVNARNPNALSAGDLVAFTTLQSRIFFPIGSMLQISNDVQTSFALFDRIFEYLDMPQDIQDDPEAVVINPEQVRGQVRMRHVKFRYDTPPPDQIPVSPSDEAAALAVDQAKDQEGPRPWTLDDVDLEILPGQLAALVGPSGAGKTTMTYLVPRLYDVQEGAVEIDGIDVRKIALESLGDMVGVVTQETYLFHTTIRRNLLYGRPEATQEELEAAARAANIHDRIAELAEGYDTIVGERGYKLTHDRVVALGQLGDPVVDVRGSSGGLQLLLGRFGPAVQQVAADRRVEQVRLLRDDADHVAERFERADLPARRCRRLLDRPLLHVVQPRALDTSSWSFPAPLGPTSAAS